MELRQQVRHRGRAGEVRKQPRRMNVHQVQIPQRLARIAFG
jgi:hypothetical protein